MNTTLKEIIETTDDVKVREIGVKIMSLANKKLNIEFIKKDGSLRKMVAIFRDNWNTMNGIDKSTQGGRNMIGTKVRRNMATVTEVLESGVFQPRTINLKTIISLSVV